MPPSISFRAAGLVVASLVLLPCAYSEELNLRPIIGILSVPLDNSECITVDSLSYGNNATSCFHSIYVKWLEGAGARVVPIPYDLAPTDVAALAAQINGVLFTGGETPIRQIDSKYMQTANLLLKLASAAPDHFPLWGTCMGMQTLSVLAAKDPSVLEFRAFKGVDGIMLPLELTQAAETSMLLGNSTLPGRIRSIITDENSTTNLHHDGVAPSSFESNANLNEFFTVLSTNVDATGKPFVSTIEGKHAPIWGVQWHPERPQFEWRPENADPIGHSPHVIEAMQWFANFFVEHARMNSRSFTTPAAESAALIYNYKTVGHDTTGYNPYIFGAPQG